MKKTSNIIAVLLLLINLFVQPIVNIHKVFAEETTSEAVSDSPIIESSPVITSEDSVVEELSEAPEEIQEIEPIIPEGSDEVVDSPINEAGQESIDESESELLEETEGTTETSDSEETEESEDETDKKAITTISLNNSNNATTNLRTGSTSRFSFNVSNIEDVLENAVIRVTIPLTYLSSYESLGQFFPNQGLDSLLGSRVEGNNLIVDYNVQTLSESYNTNFTFEFKSIDDGSMPNGAQIPVQAAVVENGSVVAQTSNVTYHFVTRQPHFSTNVTYPAETSDEDDEDPQRPTEVLFSFSFGDEGGGNGSGRSAVNSIIVTAVVPESLTFDASYNEGWQYDEASRTASYSFTPDASIYDAAYFMPTTLSLVATNDEEDIQESIYAEATFAFANEDVVTKSNQAEVSMMTELDIVPMVAVEENLVTNFEFVLNPGPNQIVVSNGFDGDVDINNINGVLLDYGFSKPDGLVIAAGDTYSITLPDILIGVEASNQPIIFEEVTVATYNIVGNQMVITFEESVNDYDNVEMHVKLSAEFNVDVFEEEQEVVVEVPYADGTSFTATIRAEQEDYEGTDKKEAGSPYVFDGETKVPVTRNPEFIDWTIRANDSMGTFESATIIDELGANLEIVEGSFVVERIIRNHNNEEIGRESVTDFTVTTSESGFELNLGDIEDAYEITYTTSVIRPEGGGTHTINNNARIILDGDPNPVSDDFEGTWSGDIPTIDKSVKTFDENAKSVVEWQVEYNYGLENLGSDVILTDTLTHGEVLLETIIVKEVITDIDGNVIGEGEPVTVTPEIDDNDNMVIPGLDANGKAYYITFQSKVPVGLINETIKNTISDNYDNTDNAEVTVNTVPTGGKVGEQLVDEDGRPYIKWTITMNSQKVDISSINIKDVFNGEYLTFNKSDTKLFQDGVEVEKHTVKDYTHTDGRIGFELSVMNAGPHVYTFEYLTYYTTAGMQQPEIANDAELIFDQGPGVGIGVDIGFEQAGPKAGIEKSGKYVLNKETGLQEIEWTIIFNNSRILLENPKITDVFTSKNYEFIDGSLQMTENDVPFTDYVFAETENGFTLDLYKDTNARYVITYRTTADDAGNKAQDNLVTLNWQGGEESGNATVSKRDPGINKSGNVVINADGSKTVNWTVNFNTNSNVIYDFVLTDTNLPSTVTISDIKVKSGENDVTGEFTVSDTSDGVFTVSNVRLDAKPYQLTYSTTLSATEEAQVVKNTAVADYRGGGQTAEGSIPSPTLGVQKEAVNIDKAEESDLINWTITANTDAANKLVNLDGAVLTDTIPADQRLVANSIKIIRADNDADVTNSVDITTSDNLFSISLPNGAYQYIVTFQTKILEYPSVNEKLDRYTNEVELSNTGYKPVSDDAYIDYFADGTNNNSTKKGSQNEDTENIDWNLTLNPLGLTINNALITDKLSDNQTYIDESIKVTNEKGDPIAGASISVSDNKQSFKITFEGGSLDQLVNITYETRLSEDLIGNYTVSNNVKIMGGTEQRELHTVTESTTASQWSFGGGGSGRTLDMNYTKLDADNNEPLEGVSFSLYAVRGSGEVLVADFETLADGTALVKEQRTGRYILRETSTLPGYVINEPIYFIYGYGENRETTIDIADSSWNQANFVRVEGESLVIYNEKQKTEVTASKVWEGGPENNRPTVYFQLYRQVDEGETETVPDAEIKTLAQGTTSVTWENQVAFDDTGNEYTFSVKEVDAEGNDFVPTGYTKFEDGLTVTNTISPIEISVTKIWDDANDQDSIRPDSVEVNLTANGDPYGEPIELSADNEWMHTFKDLPVYDNGTVINYSVQENNVAEGYESSVRTDDNGDLFLTNSYVPATTELTVNKVWNDGNNQDGLRPEFIQVQLMAGEDAVGNPVILDGSSGWTHTWEKLPTNASGEPIDYSVIESNVPEGYEATIGENVDGVITITNAHTPAVVNIPVSKVWEDADNQDGVRPETITANLLADGDPVGNIELSADNEWTHTFENLPVYNDGSLINYTVTEDTVEDYSTAITGTVAEGFVITNSYTPDETSVTVTKNWQDGNNQDGNRPESIEVQLTADGEATDHTALLNEENNWTATWSGLALNSEGTAIIYSVVETTIPEGYEVSIDDENHGNIIITNLYSPELVEISGNKIWEDNDNNANNRPEIITVNLLANNVVVETQEVSADENGNWSYRFSEIPVYEAGQTIDYTITEDKVPYYDTQITNYDIVNTYNPPKVSVGDYVWLDQDKNGVQDPNEPGIPNVVLEIRDSEGNPVTDVFGKPVGPTTTDKNGKYSFDDLPIDKIYVVTISPKDPALEGYKPTIEGQGDSETDSSTWSATSDEMLEDGQRDPSLDFGFYIPSGSVGDYVWFDANNDGLQDETDVPLEGVVLTIEDEYGQPVTDIFGNPIQSVITDKNGYYIFENLPLGHRYTVRIDQIASANVLKEYETALENQGLDVSIDSSSWFAVSELLTEDGQHDPTLDFGFVAKEVDSETPQKPTTPQKPGQNLPNTGEESWLAYALMILTLGLTFVLYGKKRKED